MRRRQPCRLGVGSRQRDGTWLQVRTVGLPTTDTTSGTLNMIPTQRTAARSLGRIRAQAVTQAPVAVHAPKTPGRTGQARALASICRLSSEAGRRTRPIGVPSHRGLASAVPSK